MKYGCNHNLKCFSKTARHRQESLQSVNELHHHLELWWVERAWMVRLTSAQRPCNVTELISVKLLGKETHGKIQYKQAPKQKWSMVIWKTYISVWTLVKIRDTVPVYSLWYPSFEFQRIIFLRKQRDIWQPGCKFTLHAYVWETALFLVQVDINIQAVSKGAKFLSKVYK